MPFDTYGRWIAGAPQNGGNMPNMAPNNTNAMPLAASAPNQVNPNLNFNRPVSLAATPQPRAGGMYLGFNSQPQAPQGSGFTPLQTQAQLATQQGPQGVQNYLQQLRQGGYNNMQALMPGNNNMQMNVTPWGNQGFQVAGPMGFNGFQGSTQNNLGPMVPGNYSSSAYDAITYGGQTPASNYNGSTGPMPSMTNSGGMPNYGVYNPLFYANATTPSASPNFNGNVGSFYSTSDQEAKTKVKDADQELSNFLDSLGIYSYEYKDKKDGQGRRISPMAQEIAKSPLGQAAISKDDRGLMRVDYGKLMGTMLASIAMDHQKIKELEQQVIAQAKGNK